MFSMTTEYALRAMICLASRDGERLKHPEIAATTGVPSGYLSRVLQTLVRAGLLDSQRGLHGGFQLARPVAELTLLEIVNAVDPIQRVKTCPLKLANHQHRLCPLHARIDAAIAHIEAAFAATTLAELLDEAADTAGERCPFPLLNRPPVPPEEPTRP